MYIRRGAIIALAPEMHYTAEKKWDPLTIEAYPPARGAIVRTIYEDDGLTNSYLMGKRAITQIILGHERKEQIELTIGEVNGTYPGALRSRGWIVRLHLDPGQTPASLWVDGKQVPIDTDDVSERKAPFAKAIFPAKTPRPGDELPMPLRGAGTAPPYRSGPVIEVTLDPRSTAVRRRIVLMLN
jgi:hypothetical protein